MIKIICTSCQKPLSLDETKLPMKEVSFPCPACKTKLVVDRRKLETAAVPAVAGEAEPTAAEDEEAFGVKAMIVGADVPQLRQAAKQIGFSPVYFATAQQARDYFLQEFPAVVMLSPPQTTPPPLESMQPIISLTPGDRRRSFFILFSDNLRTLDGNAAFLYGVNLIVSPKDLGSFPQIYRDAFGYHERLYSAVNSVMKVMAST
jgi:predicted RNA-binding Zn-ribbon protein involved in translation (DUF1610 family)